MLNRLQPQKSFGDEALDIHVSDSHLLKVDRLVDWKAFYAYWPGLYGTTGKPSHDPLVAAGVLVKRRALIDAAIVQSARKAPLRGGAGSDLDARRAVKGNKPIAHGFNVHIAVDDDSEIVRAIETMKGSVHDSVSMDRILDRAPAGAVYANAAYCDTARRRRLRAQGIFPRIRFNPYAA